MVKSLMYQCSNSLCTSVQIKYVKSLSPLHISPQVTTIGMSKSLLQWCSNHYVWCSNISCTVFKLFYMPCVTAYVPYVKRYGICMGPAHILVFPLNLYKLFITPVPGSVYGKHCGTTLSWEKPVRWCQHLRYRRLFSRISEITVAQIWGYRTSGPGKLAVFTHSFTYYL